MNTTNNESVGQKIDLFEQSKESLLDFNVNNVINNMASFLSVNKNAIRRTNTDKCAILSVPLPKAIMIDDLTEDIEKLLKLSILTVNKSDDGLCMECIAYSTPSIGDMNIIQIYSHLYGVVESFNVNVYGSMEQMYHDLMERLQYQKTASNKLLKAAEPLTIFKQFI